MAAAKRDDNRVPSLVAVSSADSLTPVIIEADPTTKGLNVQIVGDDVGVGGGVQYTEGDTDASITGNVVMWEDAANTLVAVSATKPLPVTASIDTTGLATSAKQDTMITALQLIDNLAVAVDGNYLNTNMNIAGTDVAAGAGAVTDQTQRVTHASDDPVTTAIQLLDNSVDGNYLNTNLNYAGTDAATGNGTAAGSLRVSVASDSTGQVKLAASDGVDIGNVDVASIAAGNNNIGDVDVASIVNGSINGPAAPVVDSYTHAAINLNAGANQVLASSSANHQIWVYGFGFTVNVAGTVSFQDEDDTAISGIMNIAATSGMVVHPSGNFAMPIWKLATDKDLEVDVVTSELDGWIDYAIVNA